MKNRNNKHKEALAHDIFMIIVGIIFAIILSKAGIIDGVISLFKDYYIFASFFAGIFFTSAFTLAPASITLVHIAQSSPIEGVVVFGGLGAMFGDLILFFFIRDRFTEDLKRAVKTSTLRHFMKSLHFGFMKWLSPVMGALIIASPLPDEFGITLLGMSKVRTIILMPLAFVMNMLGIYLLIQFSHFI